MRLLPVNSSAIDITYRSPRQKQMPPTMRCAANGMAGSPRNTAKYVAPNAMNAPASIAETKHRPASMPALPTPSASAFASVLGRRERIGLRSPGTVLHRRHRNPPSLRPVRIGGKSPRRPSCAPQHPDRLARFEEEVASPFAQPPEAFHHRRFRPFRQARAEEGARGEASGTASRRSRPHARRLPRRAGIAYTVTRSLDRMRTPSRARERPPYGDHAPDRFASHAAAGGRDAARPRAARARDDHGAPRAGRLRARGQ